jgi:hypothetical protein
MFKEIEEIKVNRAFKKTTGDYIKYGLFLGIGCLMTLVFIGLILAGIPSPKDALIMLLMACGFIYSIFLIKKQWIHNYKFHLVSNSLDERENHSLIMETIKRYDFEIIDNNLHRTSVSAKGKTSTLSIGSILTFVYSDNEILINARPTIGNFSFWPFYRTDLNTVLEELRKLDISR